MSAADTGSLRYAITQANATSNPAGSEIEFGALFDTHQTINLSSALPNITGTEAITGPAAGVTIARAAANPVAFRILLIASSATASLSNLTLTGGNAGSGSGGGIENLGGVLHPHRLHDQRQRQRRHFQQRHV